MEPLTFGQRSADNVALSLGSWRFIIVQTLFLLIYILWNTLVPASLRFDAYPFTFLNLMLSFQAAYSAPIIMMSQNRQAEVDRIRQIDDFEVDKKAESEIEDTEIRLGRIEETLQAVLTKLNSLEK